MLRYKLRTLLIMLAVLPPVLAGAYWGYGKWREAQEQELWRIEQARRDAVEARERKWLRESEERFARQWEKDYPPPAPLYRQ